VVVVMLLLCALCQYHLLQRVVGKRSVLQSDPPVERTERTVGVAVTVTG
jgi:hypothetical protein